MERSFCSALEHAGRHCCGRRWFLFLLYCLCWQICSTGILLNLSLWCWEALKMDCEALHINVCGATQSFQDSFIYYLKKKKKQSNICRVSPELMLRFFLLNSPWNGSNLSWVLSFPLWKKKRQILNMPHLELAIKTVMQQWVKMKCLEDFLVIPFVIKKKKNPKIYCFLLRF